MNNMSNPVVMVIVLGALSLAPFVLIMMTSFVKISVSLSILRWSTAIPATYLRVSSAATVRQSPTHRRSVTSTSMPRTVYAAKW